LLALLLRLHRTHWALRAGLLPCQQHWSRLLQAYCQPLHPAAAQLWLWTHAQLLQPSPADASGCPLLLLLLLQAYGPEWQQQQVAVEALHSWQGP
jgi:hypothetical protein